MRSGFRNAELNVVPGGAVSERATLCAETLGAAQPAALSAAGRMAARVTTPIVVAASVSPVSQSYAGIDDNTDAVPPAASESSRS